MPASPAVRLSGGHGPKRTVLKPSPTPLRAPVPDCVRPAVRACSAGGAVRGNSAHHRSIYEAIAEGDESALGRLSEHPGTLITGSDAAEWWHGPETRAVWARQMKEIGPFPVTAEEIEAWE